MTSYMVITPCKLLRVAKRPACQLSGRACPKPPPADSQPISIQAKDLTNIGRLFCVVSGRDVHHQYFDDHGGSPNSDLRKYLYKTRFFEPSFVLKSCRWSKKFWEWVRSSTKRYIPVCTIISFYILIFSSLKITIFQKYLYKI